jgi:hypothetical protein
MNLADDLERLHKIHQEGGLSDEEFALAKEKLLHSPREEPPIMQEIKTLGNAANQYASYQMVVGLIGSIIFIIFILAVLSKGHHSSTVPPRIHIESH